MEEDVLSLNILSRQSCKRTRARLGWARLRVSARAFCRGYHRSHGIYSGVRSNWLHR